MMITAQEIAEIKEAGILDAAPVKLIRTKGGFWIAVGRPFGKLREEALAAGSHPAIVKYNLAKQYPTFQESMMKSEDFSENEGHVEQHSHFLSDDLRKSGHDVYSVQKGPEISFFITKHGAEVGVTKAALVEDALVIKSSTATPEFSRAMAGAASEKSVSCGAKKLRFEGK